MIGTTQQWKQTFLYDRYGNRRFDTGTDTDGNKTTTLDPNCQVAVCNPTIDPNTNKLIGYTFDASGNTKQDAENRQFIYDAENKQVEVKDQSGASVGKYFYDGDGKRVKKISATETTVFVYNASGQLVAEYSTQISQTPQVSYLTADHLGSPRITTDANGQVISRRDFQPFGEEIQRASYGTDSVRQKFTAYERDQETELDFAQARYFNSGFGRFSSPDDFLNDTKTTDPSSWNLYSYVRNNPLKYVDATGQKATYDVRFDPNTNTVDITINASFVIFTKDKKISANSLKKLAAAIQSKINSMWGGSFKKDGYTFNVTANATVKADSSAKSYDGALKKDNSAQNVIEILNGSLTGTTNSEVHKSSKASVVNPADGTKPDTGQWNIYGTLDKKTGAFTGIEPAHEFVHILAAYDPGISGSNVHLTSWNTTAPNASSYDYEYIFSATNTSPNGYNLIGDVKSRSPGILRQAGHALGLTTHRIQTWTWNVRLATN